MLARTLRLLIIVTFLSAFAVASADDYTSTSFILRDPVTSISGGFSSSTNFGHFSSDGQTVTGEQTSTTFTGRSGFLYFPIVTSAVVSAVGGNEEATLTWTASAAELGFTVSGYEVGQSTISGGPYTFTNVGNVLTSTRTGLTAGTPYYFIVRTLDAFGEVIAVSSEVSATPTGGSVGDDDDDDSDDDDADNDDDDSGQDQSSDTRPQPVSSGNLLLEGYAHPNGTVVVLRDGVRIGDINVNADGRFSMFVGDIPFGSHLITLYGIDAQGIRSGLISIQRSVTLEAPQLSLSIFIPPTISVESRDDGSLFFVSGSTVPGASVGIIVTDGAATLAVETIVTNEQGRYGLGIPASVAGSSGVAVRSLAAVGELHSPFGLALRLPFIQATVVRGDLNGDGRINLIDFSILAYWHGRATVPSSIDLNGDGKVTLVDFSILTFYWTG